MSENALNDFVLTRLYVRLIMMWIVMRIRTFRCPGGALKRAEALRVPPGRCSNFL